MTSLDLNKIRIQHNMGKEPQALPMTNYSQAIATAEAFLSAWKAQDWEAMLSHCTKTWASHGTGRDNRIEVLQGLYGYRPIAHGSVLTQPLLPVSDVAVKLGIRVRYQQNALGNTPTECMVICETAPYKPSVTGDWGVNPISVRRAVPTVDES